MNAEEAWAVKAVKQDNAKLVRDANAERDALWAKMGFKFGRIKTPQFQAGVIAEKRPVDAALVKLNESFRKRERELWAAQATLE